MKLRDQRPASSAGQRTLLGVALVGAAVACSNAPPTECVDTTREALVGAGLDTWVEAADHAHALGYTELAALQHCTTSSSGLRTVVAGLSRPNSPDPSQGVLLIAPEAERFPMLIRALPSGGFDLFGASGGIRRHADGTTALLDGELNEVDADTLATGSPGGAAERRTSGIAAAHVPPCRAGFWAYADCAARKQTAGCAASYSTCLGTWGRTWPTVLGCIAAASFSCAVAIAFAVVDQDPCDGLENPHSQHCAEDEAQGTGIPYCSTTTRIADYAVCDRGVCVPRTRLCPDDTECSGNPGSARCGATCGDEIVDPILGEQCDDGNRDNADACTNECRDARCGDGVARRDTLDEQCDGDDLNGSSCQSLGFPVCIPTRIQPCLGLKCDARCRFDDSDCSRCGDGSRDFPREQCDMGGETESCDRDCTWASCGDGTINRTRGEQCDDGNDDPDDGCHECQGQSPDAGIPSDAGVGGDGSGDDDDDDDDGTDDDDDGAGGDDDDDDDGADDDDDDDDGTDDDDDDDTQEPDPTFIQRSRRQSPWARWQAESSAALVAKISVPPHDALVRADVPIFGLAYGERFFSYRVMVGPGASPSSWTVIAQSQKARATDPSPDVLRLTAADRGAFSGNLATWRTGLSNYAYPPFYPPGDPLDLKGSYTIRLLVHGRDGSQVEDRVTVDVGNAIPNAWGGTATSADGRLRIEIPEHALGEAFAVVAAQRVSSAPMPLPDGRRRVSALYQVREAGETFIKPVHITLRAGADRLGSYPAKRIGVFAFNAPDRRWQHLRTHHWAGGRFSAQTTRLHSHYVLLYSRREAEGSVPAPSALGAARRPRRLVAQSDNVLLHNDFERDMGHWSKRDGVHGASLSIAPPLTRPGNHVLRLRNARAGGSFAATVLDRPFDASRYSTVRFDYRLPRGVAVNLLVRAGGRWYDIGFSDARQQLAYRRVNIAHIGDIQGVLADDRWHTAEFDLYEMLRTKTNRRIVQAIVLADWDVPEFMKLRFGANKPGATYFIDNFSIRRALGVGQVTGADSVLVDDFSLDKTSNALGGRTRVFSDGTRGKLHAAVVRVIGDPALSLRYDVRKRTAFAGYISELNGLDARRHALLRLRLRQQDSAQHLLVGLRDSHGHERKLVVSPFAAGTRAGWRRFDIPLVAFGPTIDRRRLEHLSLSFAHHALGDNVRLGTVAVESIRLERSLEQLNLKGLGERNAVFGRVLARHHGFASLRAHRSRSGVYRLQYGGRIGQPTGFDDRLNYVVWRSELQGIDCSSCGTVSFWIRGAQGGEQPNVYLDDGNLRWGVDVEAYATVGPHWRRIEIPLTDFSRHGVDLTHLRHFDLAFEWQKMSGTVWIDGIAFGKSPEPALLVRAAAGLRCRSKESATDTSNIAPWLGADAAHRHQQCKAHQPN